MLAEAGCKNKLGRTEFSIYPGASMRYWITYAPLPPPPVPLSGKSHEMNCAGAAGVVDERQAVI